MPDNDNAPKPPKTLVRLDTTILVFTIMQTVGGVWWASAINTQVASLREDHLGRYTQTDAARDFSYRDATAIRDREESREQFAKMEKWLSSISERLSQPNRP